MATTHIDYRKIDYDQLLDKPITRVESGVNPNTLTTAGVYDRGDGNRFIVDVEGQNITQVIEKKDGYETRNSTDGGTTWSAWDDVEFSKSGDIDAEDVNYDNTDSGLTATDVQAAIDEIDTSVDDVKEDITDIQTDITNIEGDITNIQGDITEIKNIIEVTTMDTPSEDNEGSIVQYKGATTASFTHGYFYECVSDGQTPATYSWVRIDVQPAGAGDEHEFITQAAYDLLTPAQKAAKVYMIKEEGVPGSGLTAGTGIDITNDVISADMSTAVYDNTTSGLTATNVQDAIDEIKDSVDTLKEEVEQSTTFKGDILLGKMFGVSDTQGFFWDKTVNGSQRMYSLKKTTGESVYNFAVNSDDVNLFIRNGYAYEIRGAGTYIVKRIKLDDMTTETTNAGSSGSLSYIESKITDAIYIRTGTSNFEYLKVELDLTTSRISSSDYSTTPIGRYYNDKMYLNSSSNVYERSLDGTVIRTINNTGTVNGIYNGIIEKTYGDVSYGIFNVNL